MTIRTVNPFTGEKLAEYEELSLPDCRELVSKVRANQRLWARSLDKRVEALERARQNLSKSSGELAALMSKEMGKRIAESEAEIARCVGWIGYLVQNAGKLLAPEPVELPDGKEASIRFPPLGVILLIMPWNAPVLQVTRAAVPALLVGNGVVLKHASAVTGTSFALEKIFDLDVFRSVAISGSRAPQIFPYIDGVSFTGSSETGSFIASEAGKHLKKTVMELGGADPFVLLETADLDKAAKAATAGRLRTNGQACVASKRFIVSAKVYGEFSERLAAEFEKVRMGDPMDRSVTLGPLAGPEQKQRAMRQLDALRPNSRVDEFPKGEEEEAPGNFVAPTIVQTDAPFGDEIFAPIAVMKKFESYDEAVELANETPYGLGCSLWGEEREARKLIPELEFGMVYINSLVRGDARLPFGGVKRSGYGREMSRYGMLEFANVQAVCVG